MNKFVLPVLGLLFLTGVVSAYQINIDAPATLAVGKPLVVNGTTNFGIGTPIDVVLYYQLTTNTEIKRRIAYVQSDHTFRVVFDTTTLKKGTYKVEVPATGLGDSVNTRIVNLIDRTDEITLTRILQEYTGRLAITGTLENNKNDGVQIEVTGPDGERVFGPQYIATNMQGSFATDIAITKSGVYDVSFTDTNGYVGTKSITVIGSGGTSATPTVTPAGTTSAAVQSAYTTASREEPAYFEVKAGTGPVTVYTSTHIDWVLEYIDEKGILHTVNENGELNPEEIEIQGRGKSIFFKVYPYKYSDNGAIILYAENAQSVRVSPTIPAAFGGSPDSTGTPSETQASSLPFIACCAVLLVFLFHRFYQ